MRFFAVIALMALSAAAAPAAAQNTAAEDKLVGKWSGGYEGDATGTYTMTFARDASKALTGTLDAVASEGGTFNTAFKSIVVNGQAVTLKYDSDNGEVQIDLTIEGDAWKGSWKMIDPSTNSPGATGTLTGKKG